MGHIFGLGYVVVTAPDLEAWRHFGTQVLGMASVAAPTETDNRVYLRMDDRAWRVAVELGSGGMAAVGWEVAGRGTLDTLGEALADAGIEAKEDDDLARERGVAGLIRSVDPGGNPVEFFYGAKLSKHAFVSPRGVQFVTGPLGLGHVVFTYPDIVAARAYYLDLLGFRLSDLIGPTHFTHVNPRHHSLAFRGMPDEPSHFRHLMIEVSDLDTVGRVQDEAEAGAAPLACTLGKHTNDHTISIYLKTPSGFEIEYGCRGRTVDDAQWTVATYDDRSIWGHNRRIPVGA